MIYCVEDDSNIRKLVMDALESTGLKACGFENGATFMEALAFETPDLILLDSMLKEKNGITLLKRLKNSSKTKHISVILITAKDPEHDKVVGLESGADDYVIKPFSMMELIARINVALRRTNVSKMRTIITNGPIKLNVEKHEVMVEGKQVILTLKEFNLLERMIRNTSIVLTRDSLLAEIWGYDCDEETRTLDVHVRTLRQKLGDAGNMIETVRGVGYRMQKADVKKASIN
ncbi:MAG: response regulator transcription factor [Lachnospiraceae bacterium]|nr:response regulator transcription factor [Lachnospiraceae bacterium]